jgi:hypothetical protein
MEMKNMNRDVFCIVLNVERNKEIKGNIYFISLNLNTKNHIWEMKEKKSK